MMPELPDQCAGCGDPIDPRRRMVVCGELRFHPRCTGLSHLYAADVVGVVPTRPRRPRAGSSAGPVQVDRVPTVRVEIDGACPACDEPLRVGDRACIDADSYLVHPRCRPR